MPRMFAGRSLSDVLTTHRQNLDRTVVAGRYDEQLLTTSIETLVLRLVPAHQPVTIDWCALTPATTIRKGLKTDLQDAVNVDQVAHVLHATVAAATTEQETAAELATAVGSDTATVSDMGRAVLRMPAWSTRFARLDVRPAAGTLDEIEARLTLPAGGSDTATILTASPNEHDTSPDAPAVIGGRPVITAQSSNTVEIVTRLTEARTTARAWGVPLLSNANLLVARAHTQNRNEMKAALSRRRVMLHQLQSQLEGAL